MKQIPGLQIQKIAMGGMGLGFHENKAIFVPFTAIGDVWMCRSAWKKDHAMPNTTISRKKLDPGQGLWQ